LCEYHYQERRKQQFGVHSKSSLPSERAAKEWAKSADVYQGWGVVIVALTLIGVGYLSYHLAQICGVYSCTTSWGVFLLVFAGISIGDLIVIVPLWFLLPRLLSNQARILRRFDNLSR